MDKEVIKYRIREAWIAFSDAKFSTPIDNVTNRLISEFVFQMIDRLMEFTGTDVFLKKAEELHEYAMLRKEELALAIRPRDVERFQQYIDYLKKSDFERYNEPKFEHGLPFILTVEEIKRLNDNMKRQVEDPAETEARHQKIRALPDSYDELYDGGVPAPRFPSSSRHVEYESKAEAIKSGFLSKLEFFPSNPRTAHFPPVNSAVSKTAESHSSSAKLNPPLFRPANMISSATSAPSGSGFGSMGNKAKEKIQNSSKEASPIPVDETWEKTSTDNFSSESLREKTAEERAMDRPSRTMDNIEIPRDFRGRSVDSNAERGLVNSMAGLHISRDSRGKSVDRSSQLSRSSVMDKIRKICDEVEKKAVELEKLRAGQTVDTLKHSCHHSRGEMIDLKGPEVQKTKENIDWKAQNSDGKFSMAESVQDIGRHQEALADIRKQYEEYLKTLGKKKDQRTKDNIKISQNSTENLGEVQAQNKRRPVRVIRQNYSERREKSEDSYGQLTGEVLQV
uniref:Uncharacterized protein n=1 Tax=Bursaphelenchus xylophilus TaxID=6326 RepID=A0A1I7RX43_BURXY